MKRNVNQLCFLNLMPISSMVGAILSDATREKHLN